MTNVECHCGKDGHALNSINCPIHGMRAATDRELWRGPDEGNGAYYADSIHLTQDGGIGIECGGHVIVMPLRDWHALASGGSIDMLNALIHADLACQKLCGRFGFATGHGDTVADMIREIEEQVADRLAQ